MSAGRRRTAPWPPPSAMAQAHGLDVDRVLPRLVASRTLADADDIAGVLHERVDRWIRTTPDGVDTFPTGSSDSSPKTTPPQTPICSRHLRNARHSSSSGHVTCPKRRFVAGNPGWHSSAPHRPIRPGERFGTARSTPSPPTETAGTSPARTHSAHTCEARPSRTSRGHTPNKHSTRCGSCTTPARQGSEVTARAPTPGSTEAGQSAEPSGSPSSQHDHTSFAATHRRPFPASFRTHKDSRAFRGSIFTGSAELRTSTWSRSRC